MPPFIKTTKCIELNIATRAKKAVNRNAALETAKLARNNLSEINDKLSKAEKELGVILIKKPKL